ncbi:X-Pro dipeptidyl-peptidase [Paenibacillus sp. 32O-W]|uniref:CocE/NonD family hydrolase n=1 Tax=Paenibacillus sp. 32O-W TaxID=1695218 RepID=UPI00071F3894|nr:CocE/NonD family hydrolase [Paenibacillus sp. 32O-W]ALS26590.1 X-Pro dipeptidyl-peptidase [Paenibacillus sp. 32O-W]
MSNLHSNLPSNLHSIRIDRGVPVPMRDGVKLYADIYRPDDDRAYPVLLLRTPYNKEDAQTMNYAHPSWYARRGYVVVVQDTRGRWSSEGEFRPYVHEAEDGYDTIEWAASLPYAVPKVGMYGFSYAAAVQWLAAVTRPPHLTCIAPAMIGSDSYQGKTYRNGALNLALQQSWILFVAQDTAIRLGRRDRVQELSALYGDVHSFYKRLPLSEPPESVKELAPYYLEWLRHPDRDEYWSATSLKERYEEIAIPALHIGGWYDVFIDGTIENFTEIRKRGANRTAREHQYLFIEPWFHMPWSRYVGELDFGPEAANRVDELQLAWFGRWLKGEEPEAGPAPVTYFRMGSNTWHQAGQWPPEGAEDTAYYLHSSSRANSINGDGTLSRLPPAEEEPDTFVYHPSIAVPALGGRSGAVPDLTPMGPRNQIPVEIRNDVLIYSSEPLERDLVVEGEVRVELYASTTAENTDFVAKLVDVYPDGRSYNIAEGIVRASYRNGLAAPEPVTPGEVIRYSISLGPTAAVFRQGHRIRLHICSSLFPTYDRNPNRVMNPGEATEADFATATQTVYHDRLYPSKLWLPVVPEQGGREG